MHLLLNVCNNIHLFFKKAVRKCIYQVVRYDMQKLRNIENVRKPSTLLY